MKKITDFAWGLTIGVVSVIVVTACASPQFSYRYYPYDIKNKTLVGDQPKNDLPDSVCAGNDAIRYPCIIMLQGDFFSLKKDYLDTQQKLMDCQTPKPTP